MWLRFRVYICNIDNIAFGMIDIIYLKQFLIHTKRMQLMKIRCDMHITECGSIIFLRFSAKI
jgi:hypothetical protein